MSRSSNYAFLAKVRSWLDRKHRVAAWVLAALFVLLAAPKLPILWPNFDEGVYILQARLVRQGNVPYLDFFYHQTPLYLYALAALAHFGPDSVTTYRLFSLLSTALCGVVVMHAARRLAASPSALLAQLAFYAAPLQLYGMLALPNAAVVLLSTTGVLAAVFLHRTRWTVAGGLCLAMAVLVKPLAVPAVVAVVITLAAFREQRLKLPALVLSGLAAGLAGWLALHLISRGGFTEVLLLQARRYSGRSGFELMAHYADFRAAMIERGATTPTLWNLSEHRWAFLTGGLINGNLLLLLAAAASPFCWGRSVPRHLRVMLALWVLMPLSFSLFVWEPIWDHYFLQYVPPLAVLAGITLGAALRVRRWVWRVAAVPLVAACTILGHTQRFVDPLWYRRAEQVVKLAHGATVFSFNPLIHAVNRTNPACGLVDPMNVYGEYGVVAALAPEGPLSRFRVTADTLIACLGSDVPVVIDRYAFWFLERRVVAHLKASDKRLIFFTPVDRYRFEALSPKQP